MTVLLFIAGAALLILGAELLVRGASRLAIGVGISPLIVGLTVVAFGTSAPEMAVTVGSAAIGEGDLAVGNVVGSNIFNFLFILGLTAVVAPLTVTQRLVRLEVPLVIVASLVVVFLSLDGRIGRVDGVILFASIVAYIVFVAVQARKGRAPPPVVAVPDAPSDGRGRLWLHGLFVVAGLGFLVLGARWLVQAAVDTALQLGVSELVIGLTIVAVGTSLPEVAASILATLRGQREIAVGNIIGSNLFNLLAVLGLGGLVAGDGLPVPPGALTFDLPIMTAVAIAAFPLFFTGYAIARWEGAVLLGYYVAYTVWLVLEATDHPALFEFRQALVWFVLPITVLTLGVVIFQMLGQRKVDPAT